MTTSGNNANPIPTYIGHNMIGINLYGFCSKPKTEVPFGVSIKQTSEYKSSCAKFKKANLSAVVSNVQCETQCDCSFQGNRRRNAALPEEIL